MHVYKRSSELTKTCSDMLLMVSLSLPSAGSHNAILPSSAGSDPRGQKDMLAVAWPSSAHLYLHLSSLLLDAAPQHLVTCLQHHSEFIYNIASMCLSNTCMCLIYAIINLNCKIGVYNGHYKHTGNSLVWAISHIPNTLMSLEPANEVGL